MCKCGCQPFFPCVISRLDTQPRQPAAPSFLFSTARYARLFLNFCRALSNFSISSASGWSNSCGKVMVSRFTRPPTVTCCTIALLNSSRRTSPMRTAHTGQVHPLPHVVSPPKRALLPSVARYTTTTSPWIDRPQWHTLNFCFLPLLASHSKPAAVCCMATRKDFDLVNSSSPKALGSFLCIDFALLPKRSQNPLFVVRLAGLYLHDGSTKDTTAHTRPVRFESCCDRGMASWKR